MIKDRIMNRKSKTGIRLWVIVIWLAIWQFVSMRVGSTILLASPIEVFEALGRLLLTVRLYSSVGNSLVRITLGFLLAALAGVGLGTLSYRFVRVREFMQLPVSVIKATPVASFIIVVLIWVSASDISIVISFLMAYPVIYTNVLQGLDSQDRQLLEMAEVFELSGARVVRYFTIPQVIPFFRAACETALAMSWKAGIAAEVIGLSAGSIGERLYQAKIYLETPELLAWTTVIVIVSFAFERVFLLLIERGLSCLQGRNVRMSGRELATDIAPAIPPYEAVTMQAVTKSYEGNVVLKNFSHSFAPGSTTCIIGRSGVGKTTLLNLLLGLVSPDEGVICGNDQRVAAVFQENRLCENVTAWLNLRMVLDSKPQGRSFKAGRAAVESSLERGRRILVRAGLDPGDTRPVAEYSGGMKRRVALARALSTDCPIVIMDEPLEGLDEETRDICLELIREATRGRILIMVTHDPRDVEALGAEVVLISQENWEDVQ